jgi:hypothetical protein
MLMYVEQQYIRNQEFRGSWLCKLKSDEEPQCVPYRGVPKGSKES